MRFGSLQEEGSKRRAKGAGGFWDPLITNFQRKPHTTAHRPQDQLVTPCAQARWRIYYIYIIFKTYNL